MYMRCRISILGAGMWLERNRRWYELDFSMVFGCLFRCQLKAKQSKEVAHVPKSMGRRCSAAEDE
jgi:hypothetical protein